MVLRKKGIMMAIVLIALSISSLLVWNYFRYINQPPYYNPFGAVIEDSSGDHITIQATDNTIRNQLVDLSENGSEMWIGGRVEIWNNEWGFRFNPDTIIIAEITAEGSQSTISGISEDLDYWLAYGIVYVYATVIDIHNDSQVQG